MRKIYIFGEDVPFVLKAIEIKDSKNKKIQHFLTEYCGYTISQSQKAVCRGRVFDSNKQPIQMSQTVTDGVIYIAIFEGKTRGLKPLFQTSDFAFFDKPSGIMVHPTSKKTPYSLLDEVRYHFGEEANLAHRIDQETSGLVLVSKNKYSDMVLKNMFENKQYQKEYLAVVRGKIDKEITIDSPMMKDEDSSIGVKMKVDDKGKNSLTQIIPVKYDVVKNRTLVIARPLTGRQHQIRVHLNSIGHTIVGDPIYGIDEVYADMYLSKKLDEKLRIELTGEERLLLHSNKLIFRYNNIDYNINSKLRFD